MKAYTVMPHKSIIQPFKHNKLDHPSAINKFSYIEQQKIDIQRTNTHKIIEQMFPKYFKKSKSR